MYTPLLLEPTMLVLVVVGGAGAGAGGGGGGGGAVLGSGVWEGKPV